MATPQDAAKAKAKHPAGNKYVPKVKILERLLKVMEEHYWLYGAPSAEAPNRVERWDLRSMLDYAVLTHVTGHYSPTYATFYLQRNAVMDCIMAMAEHANYGEWRFWETEADRTTADVERIVKRTLEAERAMEKSK